MEAQKYIALVVVTDKSACAYVRWRNWAHIMNSQAGGDFEILVTCSPIFDDYILYHSACVIVTRPCAEVHEDVVKRYGKLKNKYQYKLMLDYDDILFDLQGRDTLPDYNPFKQNHNAFEGGERIGRMVRYVDAILVSTLYLAACFASRFGSDVVGKTREIIKACGIKGVTVSKHCASMCVEITVKVRLLYGDVKPFEECREALEDVNANGYLHGGWMVTHT